MGDGRSFVESGMIGPIQLFAAEFFTTAIGMPFEVGKTLLQVEYRPRKRFEELASGDGSLAQGGLLGGAGGSGSAGSGAAEDEDEKAGGRDWGAEDDELSNPEEADVYFTDRLAASSQAYVPPPEDIQPEDSGYLPDLQSAYFLRDDPEISRGNGVLGMIRRIRYTPTEGLPALWKSQLISTLHSLFSSLLQPHVHSFLTFLSPQPPLLPDVPLTALPAPLVPLGISVASHLIAHFVLSPIEIIRTRMIVMPSGHASTPSSPKMFSDMIAHEGGFYGTYFHPNVFFPTVLEHTLRPLITLSIPLVLERQLSISPDIAPLTYAAADLALNLASLLVLLPIETVRRRLQLQSRAAHKDESRRIKSIVRIRKREYVGIVEAMWRIMTEETGARRRRVMTEQDEGGLSSGIKQLYRGFGMAASAHVTVFGLGLVSASLGGRGFDGGWKEI